jgi:hypothetical protein
VKTRPISGDHSDYQVNSRLSWLQALKPRRSRRGYSAVFICSTAVIERLRCSPCVSLGVDSMVPHRILTVRQLAVDWVFASSKSKPTDGEPTQNNHVPPSLVRFPDEIEVPATWHSQHLVGMRTLREHRTAPWWAWEVHDFSRGRMSLTIEILIRRRTRQPDL